MSNSINISELENEYKEELNNYTSLIEDFKENSKKIGISLNAGNFKFFPTIGVIAEYPNIIEHLNSNSIKDKEGLWDVGMLNKQFQKRLAGGLLYGDNYALMASNYFRRSYFPYNSFTPSFVDLFWRLDNPNIASYIALDNNRVRIDIDGYRYGELDRWFGASFNKSINEIKNDIVMLRPPSYLKHAHISALFQNAYSLVIKWEEKNNIKSFQAEEFKTEDVIIEKDGEKLFPVRYIHAEYDLKELTFRHFDGAIHFYTDEEYYFKRDSDLNYNAKHLYKIKAISEKLFKLNGKIDVKTWTEFSTHFFFGNPLIIEYFEGQYPNFLEEKLQMIKSKYCT